MRLIGRPRITELDWSSWEAAVDGSRDVPPAAKPPFAQAVVASTADTSGNAVLIEHKAGTVILPVVKFGRHAQAMPFGMSCGPIVVEGSPPPLDLQPLLRELDADSLVAYVHHTRAQDYRDADVQDIHSTHIVPLHDDPRDRYRERARRKLRAAARAGVEARIGTSADIEKLLAIASTSAAAAGRQIFPDPAVLRAVAETEDAVLIFAGREGTDISAALFLSSPLEFFYLLGGTLPEERNLSPSYVAMDKALELALDYGSKFLNLGSSDGLPGVAQFKEGFGAEAFAYPSIAAVPQGLRERAQTLFASNRHSV